VSPPHLLAATAGFDRWLEFFGLVVILLAFDLFVVHRKVHAVGFREAVGWSIFWIAVALAFNGWVWWEFGPGPAADFFAAYVMEKSLSVDNLFVFVVIFSFFKVPPELRHRVLFFGIVGALVMRALFIFLGIEILEAWEPAFFLFGGLLLFTAFKLFRGGGAHFEPEKSLVFRAVRAVVPLVPEYEGGRFLVRRAGKTVGTNLLLVLLIVEGTDVVFALDSVPACIGITRDPFIIYTSNVFAILGLRALFFVLQGTLEAVPGLQAGLALVLAYVGVKMILIPKPFEVHVPSSVSLGVIVGLLAGSWAVATLMRRAERRREKAADGDAGRPERPEG
jgi:tellurite resistance protein TerC